MSRPRPDPSTGEGYKTIHVRPATYAWLLRLKGKRGSFDAIIRAALQARALYFHSSTPGNYRPRNFTFWERLQPTAEFGVIEARLCEAAAWTRNTRKGPLVCSYCGEPKYQPARQEAT